MTGLKALLSKPTGAIGLIGSTLFILMALLGPVVIPPQPTNLDQIRQGPSLQNPLGTDNNGRSILIQLFRGGQEILVTAFITSLLTTLIGVTLGSLAAYLGGAVDRVVNASANFLLTIPIFILLAVLSTAIKLDNPLLLSLLLAVLLWPRLMRTVRSQVLSLRERDYIEAAVALDLGTPHIIIREILPNMASYIIINLIFGVTSAVYTINGLIFLGFVPISTTSPSWGVTIRNANLAGAINNPDTTWWILGPVLMIALLQWFLITLSRSIEDAFNPRLQTGG
jgi:peptide/nickel transport system permease protein